MPACPLTCLPDPHQHTLPGQRSPVGHEGGSSGGGVGQRIYAVLHRKRHPVERRQLAARSPALSAGGRLLAQLLWVVGNQEVHGGRLQQATCGSNGSCLHQNGRRAAAAELPAPQLACLPACLRGPPAPRWLLQLR